MCCVVFHKCIEMNLIPGHKSLDAFRKIGILDPCPKKPTKYNSFLCIFKGQR